MEKEVLTSEAVLEEGVTGQELKDIYETSMRTRKQVMSKVEDESMLLMSTSSTIGDEARPLAVVEKGPVAAAASLGKLVQSSASTATSANKSDIKDNNDGSNDVQTANSALASTNIKEDSSPACSSSGSNHDANSINKLMENYDPRLHPIIIIAAYGSRTGKVNTNQVEALSNHASSPSQSSSDKIPENMEVDTLPSKEDEEDDCQIVESPSSSKSFKLRQPRVQEWTQSPDGYKETTSFKYNLPPWVDKFTDLFDYVKPAPPQKKNKRPGWIFRCKHCVGGIKEVNARSFGHLLRHAKNKHYRRFYKKIIDANPQFAAKKLKPSLKPKRR